VTRPDDPAPDWEAGQLRSARFDDIYSSAAGGLEQARAVFLEGCGLPARFAGRRRFTVAELGLGTGLTMLALLLLWQQHRPPGATLHLFSVEGFPLPRADAARALAAAPGLADLATPLLAAWPATRGWHRIEWPHLGATLDLAVADVAEALADWPYLADAWFFDGFAPAKNPAMWTPEILAAIAARSAPGCRAATWSVAGPVREALAANGFEVHRRPGFPPKRQRLEAVFPGTPAAEAPPPRIVIVGAGIAGLSLAAALKDLGLSPRLLAHGPSASANPAALVSPRLAAGSATAARLHAQAFHHAVRRYSSTAPAAILAEGALRLLPREADQARATATATSGLFPPDSLHPLAPADAAARLGEATAPPALWLTDALVLDPAALRAAWPAEPEPFEVTTLTATPSGWQLAGPAGPLEADIVLLAAGPANAALANLPLRPVRGAVTTAQTPLPGAPAAWGGYCIPTRTGLLFGATHDRDDATPDPRPTDTSRNLATLHTLRPALAAALEAHPLATHAGVRAAAPDHQPLAGQLAPGLLVLGGLGGRGFTLAPLLAAHIAALVARVPSPLPASLGPLVDPLRFRRR
jgi:tRNA 5-methylaminomethyl-2-thiouridine biosynthesis bifunctional protein